ncbi:hypothetical protein EDC01DRAFT_360284 [Geopyxis carbonaria]|nr:hypothetical protein EDC01DRAFT_360284 [Geopyxis carbonaria]
MRRSSLFLLLFSRSANVSALLYNGLNTTIANWQFLGALNSTIASQLPVACVDAYTAPIDCAAEILMSPTTKGKKRTLGSVCKTDCAASLFAYEKKIRSACIDIDEQLNRAINDTWLESAREGNVVLDVYWKNCLRDLNTQDICEISKTDFEIAWDAAVDEGPSTSAAKQAFCTNSCLTQTIVLTAPTSENLAQLQEMCDNTNDIEAFPFIDAMRFAGKLGAAQNGSTAMLIPGTMAEVVQVSGAGRIFGASVLWIVGVVLVIMIMG